MKTIAIFFLATIIWILLLCISYVLAMAIIYICQEVNHEIRKAKQNFKSAMWDLEWWIKHH